MDKISLAPKLFPDCLCNKNCIQVTQLSLGNAKQSSAIPFVALVVSLLQVFLPSVDKGNHVFSPEMGSVKLLNYPKWLKIAV